jgi:Protein of unknown function (DUF3147)
MTIKIDSAGLKQTKWHEYALRFFAGGLITVVAGMIARRWGSNVGGLFLAFPAIFPASATLIEKHQWERKQNKGLHGGNRGMDVAAVDAVGAAMGSFGLVAFAGACWWGLPRYAPSAVLVAATLSWVLFSLSAWVTRRRYRRRLF